MQIMDLICLVIIDSYETEIENQGVTQKPIRERRSVEGEQ